MLKEGEGGVTRNKTSKKKRKVEYTVFNQEICENDQETDEVLHECEKGKRKRS